MKGRLRKPALAEVELAFANEKSVAQDLLDPLDREPFRETAVLRYKHFPDVIGMIEEVEIVLMIAEAELDDVAILVRKVGKEADGITAHRVKRGAGRGVGRARRHGGGHLENNCLTTGRTFGKEVAQRLGQLGQ